MKRRLLFALVIFSMIACQNQQQTSVQEWKLLYKHDKDGNKLDGDKDDLLSAVRNGSPIRIAWFSKSKSDTIRAVEHVVDGEFLTIANGKEVFVQIKPFLGQRPDLTSEQLSMTLVPSQLHWVLGTNGTISSVDIYYARDTVTSRAPSTFRYDISWFGKTTASKKAKPLWE